ncbi:uncharacterized protein LOC112029317 [Quercus suber]|uniref:Uncharacterized protein n=1 Tax=Quercus suber TaxID=58331 RepID=A0AAW0JYS9_QUESU|nr:uncharacterized protein LOC112029317 isoform X1 [Quercus suber]POF03714.1 uncharacterized protein CFP56_06634 [Quercus suber]
MSFTGGSHHHSPAVPRLRRRRRKPKNSNRFRLLGPPPTTTPHSSWKFEDNKNDLVFNYQHHHHHTKLVSELFQRGRVQASARKLAAGLWRLLGAPHCQQPGIGRVKIKFTHHRKSRDYGPEIKDQLQLQRPLPISHPKNGIQYEPESSLQHPKCSMEGATKWEPRCSVFDKVYRFNSHIKLLENQDNASISIVSVLQAELICARSRIRELEDEVKSSKNKVEHLLRKVEEERISWQSREHAKILVVVDDLKKELGRERKNRHKMEILSSKLVNQVANAKLSAKQIMQNCEEEKRLRELMEEVCSELAKQIGEDEATVEVLKREYKKVCEEVEEERKMRQMAEVWREELVQMKLVDAKLALEERYFQMNKLITDLETFLRSRSSNLNVMELREAELIMQAIKSMNIQDIKEIERLSEGEANKKEIEPCLNNSHTGHASKIYTLCLNIDASDKKLALKHSNGVIDYNSGLEEDIRGGESASHAEDQGCICSLEGSDTSVNRFNQEKRVLESQIECDESTNQESLSPEISEVCSLSDKKIKQKASPVSNPQKSQPSNGEFYKILIDEGNRRLSNGTISSVKKASPCRGSAEGEPRCQDTVAQQSVPDSANPHITRGMKGRIEWPRGIQKHNTKAKLLEVKIESQKSQLRHILKQKT